MFFYCCSDLVYFLFFFSSRRRHTRYWRDWSSDVCSSDLMDSNPAFRETLGYTEKELRSLTLYDIVASGRKSVDVNIRRVLEQKHRLVGERKYRRKDGSLVDVEVSASTILRHGRETMCIVAHDVTERKRAEEAQRFLAEVGA